jgi:transposase
MAKELLPDALGLRIAPLIPPEAPKPKDGRPRISDRAALDSAAVPAPGGQETGKNPTDRGKRGTKHHLVVDAQGIPLAVLVSAANVHDSRMMLVTVDAIEPIRPNPAVDRAGDRTSCTPTKATSTGTFAWPCASGASSRALPVAASSPRTDWAATAGWLNAPFPGSTASGA